MYLLLLTSSFLLAACGEEFPDPDSSGPIEVIVEPTSALPGSTVEVSFSNSGSEQFTYGAAYELERKVDGGWEQVELPRRPIPEIGYVAPPHRMGPPIVVKLPDDLEPGTYRAVLERTYYAEFEVTDG